MTALRIGEDRVRHGDVARVARGELAVALTEATAFHDRIRASRRAVDARVQSGEPFYGVNTGFGASVVTRTNRRASGSGESKIAPPTSDAAIARSSSHQPGTAVQRGSWVGAYAGSCSWNDRAQLETRHGPDGARRSSSGLIGSCQRT